MTMDHLATIIFSSGSTGDPKGVMLSHFSIDANVQAVSQVLPLDAKDRTLGILPLFHSFGIWSFGTSPSTGRPPSFIRPPSM